MKPLRKIGSINRGSGHPRPNWWFARTIWWNHKNDLNYSCWCWGDGSRKINPGESRSKTGSSWDILRRIGPQRIETFVTGILRWFKMNCLLGATSIKMQVDYIGTCLTGEAQEWFLWNVEQFNCLVHNWNLEMVMQGLQKRFLHTLTYHHTLNKFDTVAQSAKTIQELMNDLMKYVTWMIQLSDDYTFWQQFPSALQETLHNEVLKRGYNAESSLINQGSILVQYRDATNWQHDPTTGSQWANVTDRHNLVCNNNKEQHHLMPSNTPMASPDWLTGWDYIAPSTRKFNFIELPNNTDRSTTRPIHQPKQQNVLWMWQTRPQKGRVPLP